MTILCSDRFSQRAEIRHATFVSFLAPTKIELFVVPICDRFDVVIQLFDLSVLNPYFYSHSFIRSKRLFLPTVAEIFLIYLAVTLLLARAIVILKKNSFF
jgi:hypothetical protein